MPLQSQPSSRAGTHDTDGAASTTTCDLHKETAPLVNRLGGDRPAWLAAINLTAARNFLESDPPRLAGSRVSLLRLVNSLDRDCDASDILITPGLRVELELRAIGQQAAAIAADLGAMIDCGVHGEHGTTEVHAGLSVVRNSIQDLDRAIAAMLGDRCHPAPVSAGR